MAASMDHPRRRPCTVCRMRKVRCDRQVPACSVCLRGGFACVVHDDFADMVWLRSDGLDNQSKEDDRYKFSHRRALYREHDRLKDVEVLLSHTQTMGIDDLLKRIDSEADHRDDDNNFDYAVGPFHVFSSTNDHGSVSRPSLDLAVASTPVLLPSAPQVPDDWFATDLNLLGWPWCSVDFDFSAVLDSLAGSDKTEFGHGHLEEEPWPTEPFPQPGPSRPSPSLQQQQQQQRQRQPPSPSPLPSPRPQAQPSPMDTQISKFVADDIADLAGSDTRMLIDHYHMALAASMAPPSVQKTPWQILHLPCALSTYGELELLGNSNNARVALFYALLSISANHLANTEPSRKSLGRMAWKFRQRSKRRVLACIAEAKRPVKVAKYKDTLMAVMSMVTISVFSGYLDEVRFFLDQAAELIRDKGMPKKRPSKKRSMLHTIFYYLEVNHSSVASFSSEAHTERGSSSPEDGLGDSSQQPQSPADEVETWSDYPKPLEMPPNLYDPALFERIYGIPHSLFELLSETRLLVSHSSVPRKQPSLMTDHVLSARLGDLEDRICGWEQTQTSSLRPDTAPYSHASPGWQHSAQNHFVQAMHAALVIYFYRCVYRINASMLQIHVEKVITALLAYEEEMVSFSSFHRDTCATTCWPGFVAACEVECPLLKNQVLGWFDRMGHLIGIDMFRTAKEAVEKVWELKVDAREHGRGSSRLY